MEGQLGGRRWGSMCQCGISPGQKNVRRPSSGTDQWIAGCMKSTGDMGGLIRAARMQRRLTSCRGPTQFFLSFSLPKKAGAKRCRAVSTASPAACPVWVPRCCEQLCWQGGQIVDDSPRTPEPGVPSGSCSAHFLMLIQPLCCSPHFIDSSRFGPTHQSLPAKLSAGQQPTRAALDDTPQPTPHS
jgi:hypothetical protein